MREYSSSPSKIPMLSGIQSVSSADYGLFLRKGNENTLHMIFGRSMLYYNDPHLPWHLTVANTANPSNFRHSMTLTDEGGFQSRYYYDTRNRLVGLEVTPDNRHNRVCL